MSKANLILLGAIITVLIASSAYLLLSKTNNTNLSGQNGGDNQNQIQTITTDNADESLSQTETEMTTELNQADVDIKEAQDTNTTSSTQEDLNSINSL